MRCCRAQKEAEKEKARLEKEAEKERVRQDKEAARKEKEVCTKQADALNEQRQQIDVLIDVAAHVCHYFAASTMSLYASFSPCSRDCRNMITVLPIPKSVE